MEITKKITIIITILKDVESNRWAADVELVRIGVGGGIGGVPVLCFVGVFEGEI